MSKTLTVAKWLLNVVLALMVLGAILYAGNVVWRGVNHEIQVIALPIAAGPEVPESEARAVTAAEESTGEPDDGLRGTNGSIEHEELGAGEVIGIEQEAWFTVLPFSRAGLLYDLGLAIAAVPAFILVILLRSIVASAAAGEPFTDENVERMRAIGLLIIAAELLHGGASMASQAFLYETSTSPDLALMVNGGWNVAVFILGVVILALAEVFRYGLALQSDADLTV